MREALSNTFSQQYWQSRGRQGTSRFAAEPDTQHLPRASEAATPVVAQQCEGICPAAYDKEQLNLTRAQLSNTRTMQCYPPFVLPVPDGAVGGEDLQPTSAAGVAGIFDIVLVLSEPGTHCIDISVHINCSCCNSRAKEL